MRQRNVIKLYGTVTKQKRIRIGEELLFLINYAARNIKSSLFKDFLGRQQ